MYVNTQNRYCNSKCVLFVTLFAKPEDVICIVTSFLFSKSGEAQSLHRDQLAKNEDLGEGCKVDQIKWWVVFLGTPTFKNLIKSKPWLINLKDDQHFFLRI